MMVPTVHLNGTSKCELMRQVMGARIALHTAIDALQQACPNGRDYYVQGPDATQGHDRASLAAAAAPIGVRRVGQLGEAVVDQGGGR